MAKRIKEKFKIYDWAGNDLTYWHGVFESFESAWEYILGDMTDKLNLKDDDYQEYFVESNYGEKRKYGY